VKKGEKRLKESLLSSFPLVLDKCRFINAARIAANRTSKSLDFNKRAKEEGEK